MFLKRKSIARGRGELPCCHLANGIKQFFGLIACTWLVCGSCYTGTAGTSKTNAYESREDGKSYVVYASYPSVRTVLWLGMKSTAIE